MTRRRGQHGLSLLEFTLVVTILAVLVVVAFDRIAALRVDVERAAVQRAVNRMQAALAVRFSELLARGEHERLRAWDGGNALRLIRAHRHGDGEPGISGPGEWAYADGEIVYRPAYPAALTGDPDAVGRWRVELVGNPDEPRGLMLQPVQPLLDADTDRPSQEEY